MTDEKERKEIAREIVEEMKKSEEFGECRLFSRDQADSLRSFADHWTKYQNDYFGLIALGQALNTAKKKAWITTIGLVVFGIIVLALTGLLTKIEDLIQ